MGQLTDDPHIWGYGWYKRKTFRRLTGTSAKRGEFTSRIDARGRAAALARRDKADHDAQRAREGLAQLLERCDHISAELCAEWAETVRAGGYSLPRVESLLDEVRDVAARIQQDLQRVAAILGVDLRNPEAADPTTDLPYSSVVDAAASVEALSAEQLMSGSWGWPPDGLELASRIHSCGRVREQARQDWSLLAEPVLREDKPARLVIPGKVVQTLRQQVESASRAAASEAEEIARLLTKLRNSLRP